MPQSQRSLAEIQTEIRNEFDRIAVELTKSEDRKALYQFKVLWSGKSGVLSQAMKEMGRLSADERPQLGAYVNQVKGQFEELFQRKDSELKALEIDRQLGSEAMDLSISRPVLRLGTMHPVSETIDEVVRILSRLGYTVRSGPQIELDWYNFEALNIPPNHPARDEQDTFYIDEKHVLRTQTSPIQVRTMETEKPPLRILAPGSVFRCDSDVSHSPNFHQIEGLLVDRKVSMADLKGTIGFLVRELFGSAMKVRFRPSFFPFTEPSAEFDCSCPICSGKGCRMCKGSGWIEIGGSGLVHPHVLKSAGINPTEWQGFAFGFGIERMAIIRFGVEDIRLFNENDVRFLKQFVF